MTPEPLTSAAYDVCVKCPHSLAEHYPSGCGWCICKVAGTARDGADKRPPLNHPSRKATYALAPLSEIRRGINEAALAASALIADLRQAATDPATWDEVVQLRRDLRVAEMQLDHAVRATQDWSRRAASDA